jgi:hypothetical protein
MAQTASPPFVAGDEWWQQLISYGISRKVDAQFLEPYTNNSTDQPAMDAQGNVYIKGQPAYVAANATGKISPWLLAGGAVLAVGVLAFALRK